MQGLRCMMLTLLTRLICLPLFLPFAALERHVLGFGEIDSPFAKRKRSLARLRNIRKELRNLFFVFRFGSRSGLS